MHYIVIAVCPGNKFVITCALAITNAVAVLPSRTMAITIAAVCHGYSPFLLWPIAIAVATMGCHCCIAIMLLPHCHSLLPFEYCRLFVRVFAEHHNSRLRGRVSYTMDESSPRHLSGPFHSYHERPSWLVNYPFYTFTPDSASQRAPRLVMCCLHKTPS